MAVNFLEVAGAGEQIPPDEISVLVKGGEAFFLLSDKSGIPAGLGWDFPEVTSPAPHLGPAAAAAGRSERLLLESLPLG